MDAKIVAIILVISLATITYSKLLVCYQCEVGMAATNHACMDPTNSELQPEIKELECNEKQDVCITLVYPNNMKRECGVSVTEGQPFCSRRSEVHESCTTCATHLCNSEKTGGAATMALSSALVMTFVGIAFIFQQ